MPQLDVTFVGLVLFVPDPGGHVHVLFPESAGAMKHRVFMRYDGVSGRVDHEFTEPFVFDPGTMATMGSKVDPRLVDLGVVETNSNVRKSQLERNGPFFNLFGRVTLPPATAILSSSGGKWNIGTQYRGRHMTNVVGLHYARATINASAWAWSPRRGGAPVLLDPPDMSAGGGSVVFWHEPVNTPSEPQVGDSAPHFHMLYSLLDVGTTMGPPAILADKNLGFPVAEAEKVASEAGELAEVLNTPTVPFASSPFTCVVAQAPLEP